MSSGDVVSEIELVRSNVRHYQIQIFCSRAACDVFEDYRCSRQVGRESRTRGMLPTKAHAVEGGCAHQRQATKKIPPP